MKQYVELITTILKEGRIKTDRTGTGTISTFGHQSVFYMKNGFPLLTLKNTYSKGVIHELLWFLNAMPEKYKEFGNTNIKYLVDNNVHIWDEWAYDKYVKHVSNLQEPDVKLLVDDPILGCLRNMTQKEFIEDIKSCDECAKHWGELGPVYGKQWVDWGGRTSWEEVGGYSYGGSFGGPTHHIQGKMEKVKINGINQIQVAIDTLKNRPDDRGIMVSAWDVSELSQMALRPCHTIFQFITEPLTIQERVGLWEKNKKVDKILYLEPGDDNVKKCDEFNIPKFRLSLQLYQRSCDTFLGVPFNIASFSLLLHMVAQVVNMVPYKFVHTFGDLHLYLNHKEQVNEFLNRTHREGEGATIADFNPWNKSKEPIDYWYNINLTHTSELIGNYYGPPLPTLKLNPAIKNITDFRAEDIEIIDYNPLPAIKAPVSV